MAKTGGYEYELLDMASMYTNGKPKHENEPDAKKLMAKSATTIISVNSQALGKPPMDGYKTTLVAF